MKTEIDLVGVRDIFAENAWTYISVSGKLVPVELAALAAEGIWELCCDRGWTQAQILLAATVIIHKIMNDCENNWIEQQAKDSLDAI